MGIEVRIYAQDEILFSGEARVETHAEEAGGWSLVFELPAAQVAQFQMRRGERVHIDVSNETTQRAALIDSFWLEDDAGFSGFSGSVHVRLAGEGPAPR